VPPLPRYLIAALRLFPPRPIGLVIVKKGESEAACKSPPGAITEFTISKSVAGREGGGRREEGGGDRREGENRCYSTSWSCREWDWQSWRGWPPRTATGRSKGRADGINRRGGGEFVLTRRVIFHRTSMSLIFASTSICLSRFLSTFLHILFLYHLPLPLPSNRGGMRIGQTICGMR